MQVEEKTRVVPRQPAPAESAESPLVPSMRPLPTMPERIGRYQAIQRLGQGGMATVYLARAVGIGGFEKLVALKVIHPHLVSEPEFVEMFLDEARIAARIHHPNVVEILDLGRDGDR